MRTRVDNWQARLRGVLDHYRAAPFASGQTDCGTLWADAVLAVSGVDVLGDLRGRYTTPLGAARLFRRLGVTCAADIADKRFRPVAAHELHRGDLALLNVGDPSALVAPAIVDTSAVFSMSPLGLLALPRSAVVRGWAV